MNFMFFSTYSKLGDNMRFIEYDRKTAVEYARKWAYKRNGKYYNFDSVGGDCTNFVSQCLYAGSKVMNYKKDLGWYYINGNNKSPSWTGVEFLFDFLVNNKEEGPFGKKVNQENIQLGDIIQLSFDGVKYSHSLIVTNIKKLYDLSEIKIASHTFDSYDKPISEYICKKIRFVHIEGVRK